MPNILPATNNQQSYIWCYTTPTPWKEKNYSSYIMEQLIWVTYRQSECLVMVSANCSWTWNDEGELGNLELEDIDDIQLEFSDWNSAPQCCHTFRHSNCRACSAPYSSSKITFKFVHTLKVLKNIAWIKNIQIMGFMRIQLHVNNPHTPFIKFARCCETQKLLLNLNENIYMHV